MEQKFKIQVPDGCSAKIEQQDGFIIVSFELKKWEPKDGDFIAYSFNRSNLNIGIFRKQCEPSTDGYNLHKDYITIGGDTGELLWGYETFTHDYMRPATEEEKRRLFDALAKVGKRWNAEEKRVEDLPRWRAEKGERYYYVGTDSTIDDFIEDGDQTDNTNYECGNYFKTREAAEKVAAQIRKIFKDSKAE